MPVKVVSGQRDRTSAPLRENGTAARVLASRTTASRARLVPGPAAQPTRVAAEPKKGTVRSSSATDDIATFIASLSTPSRCSPDSVQKLLFLLDTTLVGLGLDLLHKCAQKSAMRGTEPRAQDVVATPCAGKASLIAKQTVNAVIASFNNLVTAGWKAQDAPSAAAASSSRSSSAASVRGRSNPVSGIDENKDATHALSTTKVLILFDCFRVATHYLLQPRQATHEVDTIVIGVTRKVVALHLWQAASTELEWLRKERFPAFFSRPTTINMSMIQGRQDLASLLLDIQSLSVACQLAQAADIDLPRILDEVVDGIDGSVAVQSYVRHAAPANASLADRNAYFVERCIMSCTPKGPPSLVFLCRQASLKLLVTVSDLDVDAFWDRVTRIGFAHFRASQEASARSHFKDIDALFRDVHTRVQQRQVPPASFVHSANFDKFCEAWTYMARKVSDVDALQFINTFTKSGVREGGTESDEADAQLSQICARLVIMDAAMNNQDASAAQDFLEEVDALSLRAFSCFARANNTQRRRALQEAARIRRRCCKMLEGDEQSTQSILRCGVSALRTSSTLIREQCRIYTPAGEGEVGAEQMTEHVDDYIRTMRFIAKIQFNVSDQGSHKACQEVLRSCVALLEDIQSSVQPSLREVCEWKRSLSISWHYIGAQLYSHKQLLLSIPFLEQAAQLATESHTQMSAADMTPDENYVQQAKTLSKRWEHLGMAFRLTSQTGRAEEAFSAALEYVLPSTWDVIAKKAASHSISETFSSAQKGDPLEECGHLIKMAYELQVFDLMKVERGEETILDRVITQCSLPNLAKGAVVEYCLSALHRHSHRAEYPKAYLALLDIVEGIYSQGQTPLRLARIKMLRLESLLLQGRQAKDEEVQAIQGALQILFDCKQLHEDGQLIRYQRQYRSRCALYEAILSYDSDGTQENIIRAVELLSVQAKETKVKGDKSAAVAKKETLRPSSAPRQADTRAPKTPTGARGRGIAKVDAKTAHVDATATAIYDEPEKIIQLCELLVEMCSVDGTTTSCIHLIEAGRTIAEHTQDTDAWLRLSTGLAQQHLVAGHTLKALRICDKIGEALQDSSQSVDSYSRYLFCRAECHSRLGQQEKAVKIYESASLLAQQTDAKQKTSSSSIHGALQRVLLSERQAMAFSVTAQIYFASGRMTLALQSGLNGVRAAMRAGMSLTRLTTSNDSNKEPSPFEPLDGTEILEQGGACRRISAFSSMNLASMHWRSVNALQGAYMRISQLYCIRGSAKDAEGFAGEAIDFARKTGARRALKLALLERGGLRIRMGQLTKAMEDVDAAIAVPDPRPNPPLAAVLAHVQGDHRARTGSYTEAAEMFAEGRRLLCELKACDRGNPVELDDPSRVIIPLLQATLTHREAWLLHKMNDEQRLSNLLQEYDHRKLGLGSAELSLVRAMMAVQQASKAFQHDQLLSLVPDAVITLPSAVERGPSSQRSDVKASKTAMCHLREAVAHLDRIIESSSKQCTSAVVLREARSQRLMCSILVSALDQEQEEERIDLLTTSSALTLELELEEAIENKLAVATRENTGKSWPSFTPENVSKKAIPRRATSPSKRGAISASEESSEGEQDTEGRQIWMAVRERRAQAIDMALPSNWTVVSISLSVDRRCLLMERRSGKRGAILFSIPIDRQSRREGEEGALQVDAVLEELRDIVDESNTATHAAHELDGLEGRKAWWTRRRELDNRLRSLLTAIDSTWLGAFRCVLAPAIDSDSNGLAALRRCMCDILTNACFPNANSKKSFGVELNTDALDLFSALDMTNCSDEDLEDLIHFAMDAFQLHGVPVAVDEIDLDVCVTDLRAALDSFQARRATQEKGEDSDDHLFLVLDKDLSGIPWESMPSLRTRAICRIPSLAMLQDRLAMDPQGRLSVDLKKAKKHYLLNPSQELTRTQDRFAPLFEDSKADKGATRWRGIAGRSPTMDEYGKALESSDLLLYFGHGGAEQYVRPSRLRGMMRCAVTMLWGCSSGALRDMGDFDRTGTPYNYLMAGCPSLVSLLWDATDKELDGVSESVLRLSGVIQDGGRPVSIARAVAQSRDACKLPYLTGAACVVYGVPVYFSR